MKKYVITLSQVFPVTHCRNGEPTGFKEAFFNGLDKERDDGKIHTIRANYDLWKKRFDEIEAGRACLCIRQWTGKPYCSKQVEIAVLTKEDGIGIQKLEIVKEKYQSRAILLCYIDGKQQIPDTLAKNDGLSFQDWCNWFSRYDLTEPLAVIQFTKFRY